MMTIQTQALEAKVLSGDYEPKMSFPAIPHDLTDTALLDQHKVQIVKYGEELEEARERFFEDLAGLVHKEVPNCIQVEVILDLARQTFDEEPGGFLSVLDEVAQVKIIEGVR